MAIKSKNEAVQLKIVDPNSPVILTVTIGNAQIGGSVVFFKATPTVVIAKGEISKLPLGTGNQLKTKVLTVVTNILDSNISSRNVVATYGISNCLPSITVFHDSVDKDGDIFSYHVEFTFQ
jgi:hypothetical protein